MPYQVKVQKRAIKALEQINEPYYSNVKVAISNLAFDPRPNGYIKLKGRNGFRIRVGNYRIIYEIFDNILLVEVIDLGDRKNIYD
jgi:mRNA interferase RelE/StbE